MSTYPTASSRTRLAFVLHLKPGVTGEYRRRHERIWPELAAAFEAQGVLHYSIHQDAASSVAFAYVEVEDAQRWAEVGRTEVGQRWRAYMSNVLVTHPDGSPLVTPLSEVFYFESCKRPLSPVHR